jgi:SAM-dependent methyltransferase
MPKANLFELNKKNVKAIRRKFFSGEHSFDEELVEILKDEIDNSEFDFLRSPVIQNIYKYQINYLINVSKILFNTLEMNVLDWGCGKGHASYWLKKQIPNLVSADAIKTSVSSIFTTSAFELKSPIISAGSIEVVPLKHDYLLPFEDAAFDVVISFGVLEHVSNDIESLKEINRILRPGGLFFCFYLPYKFSYTQNIQHWRGCWYHDRLYDKKMVKNLLKMSNFKLIDMWHRALFPKSSYVTPYYHIIEKIDNWLCNYSFLRYFATNIEFLSQKI